MANTREEISRIHTRALATPNKKYYRDDGQVFVGTPDKRLRVLDKAELTRFKATNSLPTDNVQTAIETISNKLNRNTKQIEIDFGNTPYTNYKIFTITDSDIKPGDIIIANIAYEAPTNKSLDELEMDAIQTIAGGSSEGSFQLLVKGLEGSLHNTFKVNYTTQWL